MAFECDVTGSERAALDALVDFSGLRVLEVGCGDGRLTWPCALTAAEVLAVEPNEERMDEARRAVPAAVAPRIRFLAARAEEMQLDRRRWDAVYFTWSL